MTPSTLKLQMRTLFFSLILNCALLSFLSLLSSVSSAFLCFPSFSSSFSFSFLQLGDSPPSCSGLPLFVFIPFEYISIILLPNYYFFLVHLARRSIQNDDFII
ncbi:hypothetical protein GGI35DRAFT_250672 [Trichoderma velutinum]